MTDEQAKLAREHAATLENLIDDRQDDLAAVLGPIRAFLLEAAGEPPFDGPGEYTVAVYYTDDDSDASVLAGTWTGEALSRADARKQALDEYEDDRIEGWHTEVLEGGELEEEDEEDEEEEDEGYIEV